MLGPPLHSEVARPCIPRAAGPNAAKQGQVPQGRSAWTLQWQLCSQPLRHASPICFPATTLSPHLWQRRKVLWLPVQSGRCGQRGFGLLLQDPLPPPSWKWFAPIQCREHPKARRLKLVGSPSQVEARWHSQGIQQPWCDKGMKNLQLLTTHQA